MKRRQVLMMDASSMGPMVFCQYTSGMSRQVAQDGDKEKILALLSVNPRATTADLLAEAGLSVSGVEKNIRELKATGRLRCVGPDKGGALGSGGAVKGYGIIIPAGVLGIGSLGVGLTAGGR